MSLPTRTVASVVHAAVAESRWTKTGPGWLSEVARSRMAPGDWSGRRLAGPASELSCSRYTLPSMVPTVGCTSGATGWTTSEIVRAVVDAWTASFGRTAFTWGPV